MRDRDSSDRHHFSDIAIAQWIAEIPQNTKLHAVRIETMLGVLAIGAGGEERVAILTMKGLIPRLSGSVFN